jgi:SSS family solute:Na+ symporter
VGTAYRICAGDDQTHGAGCIWRGQSRCRADFSFLYASGVLFLISIIVVIAVSLMNPPQDEESIKGLTYTSIDKAEVRASIGKFDVILTAITLSLVVGMYLYFSFWL